MKAVVAAFNQEKALVGAFSLITNLRMELFEALVVCSVTTSYNNGNDRWIVRGLEARGHNLTKLLRGGSIVQAIAVDRDTGEIHANADFRKQGSVDGF